MLSFISREPPTGFDDKAEVQVSELAAIKQTFTIACRQLWCRAQIQNMWSLKFDV